MAIRYRAGTKIDGWNFSAGEEAVFVALLEEIRPNVQKTERWLAELDTTFYEQGRGVLSPVLERVNMHARRLGLRQLEPVESGWTQYMHLRDRDRTAQREVLREKASTREGREMLRAEGTMEMSNLPPPMAERAPPTFRDEIRRPRPEAETVMLPKESGATQAVARIKEIMTAQTLEESGSVQLARQLLVEAEREGITNVTLEHGGESYVIAISRVNRSVEARLDHMDCRMSRIEEMLKQVLRQS